MLRVLFYFSNDIFSLLHFGQTKTPRKGAILKKQINDNVDRYHFVFEISVHFVVWLSNIFRYNLFGNSCMYKVCNFVIFYQL